MLEPYLYFVKYELMIKNIKITNKGDNITSIVGDENNIVTNKKEKDNFILNIIITIGCGLVIAYITYRLGRN